jgi:hypothetical protein
MVTRDGQTHDNNNLYQLTRRDCLNVKTQTHPNPISIIDNSTSPWHHNASAGVAYSFGGMHVTV